MPNAGGRKIDANYGFTAKVITYPILLGTVAGEVDPSKRGYIKGSYAQSLVVLSDAKLADMEALIAEPNVNARYNLDKRN